MIHRSMITASVKNGVSAMEFGLALVWGTAVYLSSLSYLSAYLRGSWMEFTRVFDVHLGIIYILACTGKRLDLK
jgi:hypothetical protein